MDTLRDWPLDVVAPLPVILLNLFLQSSLVAITGIVFGRLLMSRRARLACQVQRFAIIILGCAILVQLAAAGIDYRRNISVFPNFATRVSLADSKPLASEAASLDVPIINSPPIEHRDSSIGSSPREPFGPDNVTGASMLPIGEDENSSIQSTPQFAERLPQQRHPATKNSQIGLSVIVCLVIGAGCLYGVTRFFFALHAVTRLRRDARPANGLLAEQFALLCQQMRLERVQLLILDGIKSPCTVGFRSPSVIVPSQWEKRFDTSFDVALMHELMHVSRRDSTWILVSEFVKSFLWLHPIVHVLARDHRLAIELACDEAVLESGVAPCEYAEALVNAASLNAIQDSRLVVPMVRQWQISKRIERILDDSKIGSRATRWQTPIVWMSTALLSLSALLGGVVEFGNSTEQVANDDSSENQTQNMQNEVTLRGQVTTSHGQPAANATVRVVPSRLGANWIRREQSSAVGTSICDASGNFEVTFSLDHLEFDPRVLDLRPPFAVIASLDGWGQAWMLSQDINDRSHVELALPEFDDSVRGTIRDLDGNPIERALVWVASVGSSDDNIVADNVLALNGKTISTLNANVVTHTYRNQIPGYCLSQDVAQISDENGRFEFSGFGANKLLTIVVEKPGIEKTIVEALSSRIDPIRWTSHPFPAIEEWRSENVLYGNSFELILEPASPIVGRVIDAESGESIANCQIGSYQRSGNKLVLPGFIQSTSDEFGRFQVDGMPIGPGNSLVIQPPIESNYLPAIVEINSDRDETTIALRRGIRVRGTVMELNTRAPVAGNLQILPTDPQQFTNGELMAMAQLARLESSWASFITDNKTGSFELVCPPGGGRILFFPTRRDYLLAKDRADSQAAEYQATNLGGFPVMLAEAAAVFEYDEDFNGSNDIELFVERGNSITINILDESGSPLEGVHFASERFPYEGADSQIDGTSVTLNGIGNNTKRRLFFVHFQRRIGCSVVIDANASNRLTEVQLAPIGAITGRVVDEDEEPCPNLHLSTSTQRFTDELVTDADGRFSIVNVLVGERVFVGGMDGQRQYTVLSTNEITPESFGDVGDLTRVPYPSD